MFRPAIRLVLLLALGGCRSGEPALIGSAYPLPRSETTTITLVETVLGSLPASTPVWIEPWVPVSPNVEGHAEQADLFAANRSVVGVVGHGGSRDALIGAAIYNLAKVPQIVPTATSRQLKSVGAWTFMMVPDDSVEGDFLAAWALDSAGARRVAVMYVGDEYGIGIREGVRLGLQSRGVDLLDNTVIPTGECLTAVGADVYRMTARAAIQRATPDAIVIAASSPTGWCMIRELHAADSSIWILAADGVEVGYRAPIGGFNSARVRGVAFWQPGVDSINIDFIVKSRQVLGREPSAAEALMYDAFLLFHHAVQEVGADRRAVRAFLESLGRTRAPWRGVTGPVSFEAPRLDLLRMDAPGHLGIRR